MSRRTLRRRNQAIASVTGNRAPWRTRSGSMPDLIRPLHRQVPGSTPCPVRAARLEPQRYSADLRSVPLTAAHKGNINTPIASLEHHHFVGARWAMATALTT